MFRVLSNDCQGRGFQQTREMVGRMFPLFLSEYCWLSGPLTQHFSFIAIRLSLSAFLLFFFFWLKFFQLEQTLIFWRHLFPERGGIRFLRHFLNTPVDITWTFNSVPTHSGHGVPACLSHSPEKSLHSQGPSKLTQSY